MTSPSAGRTPAPAPQPLHGCVRCGRPIVLERSLCEFCNPLGLEQPATTQVHGTVFVAIVVAVLALAVAGRVALSGVGPFQASVVEVLPVPAGLAITLEVTNDGSKTGATTCHLTITEKGGVGPSHLVVTPRIEPGQPRRVATTTDRFGTEPVALSVGCKDR